ncbi:MAG: VanW family protein [Peptococcaceae bacterium]|nr:VanW family protein [Peptococcaceae bacterium]
MFLVVQLLFTVGLGVAMAYSFAADDPPYRLRVGNLNLEGYSQAAAWEEIRKNIPTEVEVQGRLYPLSTAESSERARAWLRKQYVLPGTSLPEKLGAFIEKFRGEKVLADILLREEIVPQLEQIKKEIDRPVSAASFVDHEGQALIIAEEVGYAFDVEEAWQKIARSYSDQPVSLSVNVIEVNPTEEQLALLKDVLGEYVTFFNPNDANRTNNLRVAAQALNNTLVAPGEEFSFNRTVGERTAEAGYKEAVVFIDQSLLLSDGGGICQDSSTLYQAVRQANLPVVERNSHTLPVDYVPRGQDATVAYGLLDFRFRNDMEKYLLIRAKVENNWLKIQIVGCADENHPPRDSVEGYYVSSTQRMK